MEEIKARLGQIEKKLEKLDELDQMNRQINVKLEEIEKQQNVLNGDLRSLMNDIMTEIKESRKNDEVINAKIDTLTAAVIKNEHDLNYLEENYHRTASEVAFLKRIK